MGVDLATGRCSPPESDFVGIGGIGVSGHDPVGSVGDSVMVAALCRVRDYADVGGGCVGGGGVWVVVFGIIRVV